jgi:TPR repeat protein
LRRSAELCCALVQAKLAEETSGVEQFRFASLAASQREREGFFWLGRCLQYGCGCEDNENKSKENYLIAAELAHVPSMSGFGDLSEQSDPLRWVWLGEAAKRGAWFTFLNCFFTQVQEFESGSNNAAVVFQIGKALNGNVDLEKRTIFGRNND